MKKIFFVLAVLVFTAPVTSFAADQFPVSIITLSKGVSGTYFINTEGTEYSLSTGHAQGNRVYATTSKDSLIYYKVLDTTFASTDLLDAHNADSFASTPGDYTNH